MNCQFSVIIPSKDEEKYIRETLSQFNRVKKLFKIELIVADGNSSDKTVSIARKVADKVIVIKRKHTIGEARNEGAKAAKGKVLVFIDSDVRLDSPEKFFRHMSGLFRDDSVTGATVNIQVYPQEARFYDKFFHDVLNISAKFSKGARGECQVVRRSAFEKSRGYRHGLVAGEDFDLFSRLAGIGKLEYAWNVKAYESPRHFRRRGYLVLFAVYLINYLSTTLFGRAYSKEWEEVR